MSFQKNLIKEYGIELNKNYSGQTLIDILTIVEEENGRAIKFAFEEGYKAAFLEYKPEMDLSQIKYNELQQKIVNKNIKNTLLSLSLGILAGGIFTSILMLNK